MSKKDYIQIARILRESTVTEGYDSLCYSMADYIGGSNPEFDRELFLQACSGFVNW